MKLQMLFLLFDHCGGGIWDENKTFYKPLFKNSKYWSNKNHWDWAQTLTLEKGFFYENLSQLNLLAHCLLYPS